MTHLNQASSQSDSGNPAIASDTWIGGKPGRATPIRVNDVIELTPGGAGKPATLSPAVRAVMEKCFCAAGRLYTLPEWAGVKDWLAAGAEQALEYFGGPSSLKPGVQGGPVGAWMAIVARSERIETRRVVALASVGYSGFSPEQIVDVAHAVCTHPATWSESVSRQVDGSLALNDQARIIVQGNSADEAARVVTPLGRFIRCVSPVMPLRDGRALVWQVDGRIGAWSPTASDVCSAEALAPALARAYAETIVRRDLHRERLIQTVSASQSQILPLLAEGLSQRQISERVNRSLHTVHDHVKGIYSALGIKSRYQLYVLWNGGDPSKFAGED